MTHYKTLTALGVIATTSFGGAVYAGSLADPVVETPVIEPAPMVVSGDWTGFYTGLQLGYADVDGPDDLDGDNGSYGFHAGYDYDFGDWVVGGEVDYDKTDVELNDGLAELESVARLKLKGGYDLGNTLVYATAGYAAAEVSGDSEDGAFAGVGVSYKISDRYMVGAEVLHHQFNDIGDVSGADVDATTFNVRGSLRF
ncbi:Outer membrane protein [Sulfitobacter noctilucae]|uniref:outer membrane protein n=1 Tax=Sulfitobacter noctilucae TaxID=1342302 RepID=UPI00046A3DF4|nr:outer membrane beta-barrel protein [Sulfitobacter noctilucae]KIN61303.1 Outer membrane protein [Sulfitobacter noctilucae]